MAHLLVTGGAGYVGSHTLRALRRAGHSAVVLDDLSSGRAAFAAGAPLCRADVRVRAAVERVLADHGPFDGILHFAAAISVAESLERPLEYYELNAVASLRLVEAALVHGVRAFVLSSTAAVYGTPACSPIPESAPLAPTTPYGASKAMAERLLSEAARAHGLRGMSLRYFNAAGAHPDGGIGEAHDPETHLIPSALEAAAGLRAALQLYGTDYETPDGTCIRDYVHVSDLADAHVCALEALLAGHPGGAFNLGTGRGHSNREVLETVSRVVGRRLPVQSAPRRAGDPPRLVADARRFGRELGWEPQRSGLEHIVETAWAWLRSERKL